MDWTQAPRVLLVWPDRGRLLSNRLDLVILERYCSAHGSQLALMTKNPEIQFHAEQAGIPVFHSRKSAQLQPWRKSFREFRRRDLEEHAAEPREVDLFTRGGNSQRKEIPLWGRITLFTLGVLGVLSIAGMLLPSAEVSIQDEKTWRELVIPVQVDPDLDEINFSGILPAREATVLLEEQASRSATGQISIPETYSQGEVIFSNLAENPIQIPKDTILSTATEDPILFITLSPGETPAGQGEEITIKIQALEPGSSGNVDSSSITRINHEFGADLSVYNPEPTSRGSDLLIPSPSQEDRELLSLSLQEDLDILALEKIRQQLSDGDILLSPVPYLIETVEETFIPIEGSSGDTLKLTRRVRFGILFVSGKDLRTLAINTVNAQYRGSELEAIQNSISVSPQNIPVISSDPTQKWDLEIKWIEKRIFDKTEIIQLVLGKIPTEAEDLIQEFLNLSDPPVINLQPQWWFRLPALPFRININLIGGEA